MGQREYSMRAWLDPQKLASLDLTASDIVNAIREQNVDVAAGNIGQQPVPRGQTYQLVLNTQGRLTTAQEFGEIIVKVGQDGRLVHLRDVAELKLGAQNSDLDCAVTQIKNDKIVRYPSVALAVYALPQANALNVATLVKKKMEELKKSFPQGLDYQIPYDTTPFIRQSVGNVLTTIYVAAVLVIIVVLIFIQEWHAVLLPMFNILVALIGTFAIMAMMGFSLNNLSLFGLVLAVGIVVDDSIVLVENIERWMGLGLAPREATLKSMEEITGPVVGISLVLCSVFIPTAFMPGLTGQFFRQFALTIAFSAILSATNVLTTLPAVAVAVLKPHAHGDKGSQREALPRLAYGLLLGYVTGLFLSPILLPHLRGMIPAGPYTEKVELGAAWAVASLPGLIVGWFLGKPVNRLLGLFFGLFNKVFDLFTNGYTRVVGLSLRLCLLVLVLYAGLVGLTGFGFATSPTGFIPDQDQGYLIVNVNMPDAASVQRTVEVSKQLEEIALKTPGVKQTMTLSGFSAVFQCDSSNWGTIFIILDDFSKRTTPETQAAAIIRKLNIEYHFKVLGCQAAVFGAPPVPGLGQSGGFQLQIEDLTGMGLQALQEVTDTIVQKANAQPGLARVFTTFSASTPQRYLDIDREKAKQMGVALNDVFNTLNSNMGSVYINQFNEFGRIWQVNIQAEGKFRTSVDDLGLLYVRNKKGEQVPLASLIRVRNDSGPVFVMRYNDVNSSAINGGTRPGFSSGQAISVMERLCNENLPAGMGYEWTNISYQEVTAGSSGIVIFALGVVLIFLVLAAMYESWGLPLSIILVVPMCLLSSIAGLVWIAHKPIDIFSQIGFVVLVAMAAKNAILIVAYARDKRIEGMSRREATLEACKLRLRPILMTSFAFILGVFPLVVAVGAGWEMQRSLGTAVFSGMLGVTFFGIFLTPVFYYVITWFGDRPSARVTPPIGPSPDGEHKTVAEPAQAVP
jgi:multidrug efflux pump